MNKIKRDALRAAFPRTLPICAGFAFLGLAYGIYMNSKGFSFLYPLFMSMTIFAGSMEFVTVNLLLQPFQPLHAFFLAVMVNARHLFYGLSMLERYKNTGWKKFYLIFGMCDESFTINCTTQPPEGVDQGWYMFFVTFLNQSYWVLGSTLGGLLGNVLRFDTTGIDFVMTALFVVIFLDQWFESKQHLSAVAGIACSALCLVLFKADHFILPAMGLILLALTALRKPLERKEKNL